MPRITQDPTNVVCPNFTGAAYAAIRQAMSNGGQIPDEQAVQQLTAAWNQTHAQDVEAWNQQIQANVAEQAEQQRLMEEEADTCRREEERQEEEERREQEKKKPKINDFDENKMVGDYVAPRPSQFAISKLKSFNYVELWYFTAEGCTKAHELNRVLPDDAYGLTRLDDVVALKPVASFKASRNVIPDADLTWRQLNMGKNTMLRYMEICEWPRKHIDAFTLFYFNLEIDEMRLRTHGERILLAYQAIVRRQWHEDLTRGKGFNIAAVNQKLLSSVADEVWDSIRTESIKQISNI